MTSEKKQICVIGPGKKFLGGISYYTIRISNALSATHGVSVVLIRNLVPKFLFPGGKRVGKSISPLEYDKGIPVLDGIDWYWFPSIFRLPGYLRKQRPDIILFQWWSGSVAHTYLLILFLMKIFLRGSRSVLLFHEVLDPAEDSLPLLRIYAKIMGKLLFPLFDAYAVHSRNDLELIHGNFRLPKERIHVVTHGSYDHFARKAAPPKKNGATCSLLYFGLIRPYKGVEYLVEAFDRIPEDRIDRFSLTIAGEPWDYPLPGQRIASSRYRDRITFINRYVTDDEVDALFQAADVAVFPYTRASQSGAAHTAISYGIPVIISRVGGLKESMGAYEGTLFVEPGDVDQLTETILKSYSIREKRFPNPHTWEKSVSTYEKMFQEL